MEIGVDISTILDKIFCEKLRNQVNMGISDFAEFLSTNIKTSILEGRWSLKSFRSSETTRTKVFYTEYSAPFYLWWIKPAV